ncbi:MAG TPA: hypothetical protein DCQ36_07435 [Actinobacteria bacterium]|jgi:hypothetical protein|nr:hypothetical protein [Actinomycetota bacterium]
MEYDTDLILDLQPRLEGRIFRAPEGVALSRGVYGLGLVVTRPVRAGEAIYRSGWFTVPNADHSYRVLVEIDGSVEEVDVTRTHSVKYRDTRTFDIPGCFMNHACSPTSVSVDLVGDGSDDVTLYDQVALVDLAPGDPINCDYTLFDWDCDGHCFTCSCGSAECYGPVAGFEGLPRHLQERLMDQISYESARMWAATH